MNLNIGILLSNTDRSDFAARFENDAEKAATLLRRQRPDWRYSILMAIDGELPANAQEHDGYLVTGSPASVNSTEPWLPALFEFLRAAHRATVPMVGLCFGHQAIAHALGGRVERAAQWGLGVSTTTFDSPAPWMQPARSALQLHAAHEDQVVELPKDAVRLGGNDSCRYGGFAIGDHVFTTQFHPEFPPEFMRALITDRIGPGLGQVIVDQATAQLQTDPSADADLFAQWIVRFYEQAKCKAVTR